MRFLSNTNIDFMSIRKIGFIFSGTLMLLSIVSLILHGGPRFGVDFRGGTSVQYHFSDKNDSTAVLNIPVDEVRNAFASLELHGSEIKHFGSNQEILVYMDQSLSADTVLEKSIKEKLTSSFPNYNIEEMGRDNVGPKIGQELVYSAILSIIAALGLILVYIMIRFELKFGIGAVAALFHDVVITLGIFSLFEIEITVAIIAALLTIIGYSLNDTIVVFDRIRENMKAFKRQITEYASLVNTSINETLSRTIVTSGTTMIVVIILYFFGTEITKDFAFALLCGVIIGTYSSIFIASPILVEWESKKSSAVAVSKK